MSVFLEALVLRMDFIIQRSISEAQEKILRQKEGKHENSSHADRTFELDSLQELRRKAALDIERRRRFQRQATEKPVLTQVSESLHVSMKQDSKAAPSSNQEKVFESFLGSAQDRQERQQFIASLDEQLLT
jgi:HD superfamily phosphohydrolase